jgi:putative nucleotidyltransferase with HDIG domain
MMPGRSGIDLLQDIKKAKPHTAVLMLTAINDMDTAMNCIHMGADDYIVKPFNIDRMLITVRNALEHRRIVLENIAYHENLELKVQEQTQQIRETMNQLNLAYESSLTALIRALDARERETGSHSERVKNYTITFARKLRIPEQEIALMGKGALLHDIGKIGVTDSILLKPGKLTEDEWTEMRRHSQIGYDILAGIDFLRDAAEFVLSHHERFDGSGYPNGLKGAQIPLGGRIFALVDTLDAMTSDRPYRKALPFDTVVTEIGRCNGTQFDPELVKIFLDVPQRCWEDVAGRKFL